MNKKAKTERAVDFKTLSLFHTIAKVLSPPPIITVSEWADMYRKLSPESSAEPGQWSTDRTPYLREIMDALNKPECEEIVVMSSSQVGKTELILNILGYFIAYDPAPILVVEPTITMAQDFSKERLAPMIRDTQVLQEKINEAKAKDASNTILDKQFPGGHITIAGANSPASLASRPIRIVLLDEVDRYPASAGAEGSPIVLAEKRTTSFWNKKSVKVSTPTIKGASEIEKQYESGSMEEWNVPCPCCGKYQPYEWGRIVFSNSTMECKFCGEQIGEIDWKAGKGKYIAKHPERIRKRTFHLNELASPWKHWDKVIEEWHTANEEKKVNGDINKLKAFINTSLGETWEEKGASANDDALLSRRERYDAEIPDGVLVLTAGIDVQDNRFEIEIVGWGRGCESWGIRYDKIFGDPEKEETWDKLEEYLLRELHFKSGTGLLIASACIDTGGHFTTECYKWLKKMQAKGRRIYGVKGMGGPGIPLIYKKTRNTSENVEIFILGVDSGKEIIMTRLKTEDVGPGYCHFPINTELGYNEMYIKGLNSEQRVIRMKEGHAVIKWVKKSGARNEPFDIRNYATAAVEILKPDWDVLERKIKAGINYMKAGQVRKKKKAKVVSHGVQI